MKHKLFLIASILSLSIGVNSEAHSQWIHTNSPSANVVTCFAVSGTNLFAGTFGGGIYLSTDNGTNWTAVNTGLTNTRVYALLLRGTKLFAATGHGVFSSTNNGANWGASGGLEKGITTIVVIGTDMLVAADEGGLALSTDNGVSWTSRGIGLPPQFSVVSLLVSGTNVFAATFGGGVYRSTDNGTNWTAVNANLTNTDVYTLAVSSTNVFAGTFGGGVFLSTDNGADWTAVNSGLTNDTVVAFDESGPSFFAGTLGGGVFLSTDNGTNWAAVNSGLTTTEITDLFVSSANLFAGTAQAGIWRRPLSEFGLSAVPVPVRVSSVAASYPNPFSESASIRFNTTEHGRVEVRIVNLLGTEVARIFTGELESGEHSFNWDAIGVSPGRYECVISMNSRTQRLPLLLLR